MSDRPILDPSRVAATAREHMASFYAETVHEVVEAVRTHDVVVVGMAQNPHVKAVRAALEHAGVPFHYVGYGSYVSQWRRRLAVKLWSGWPTFPQVFVRGELIGGEDLTKAALADGSLAKKLAE